MSFEFNALIPEFYVADFQKSLHFYLDVLGFELEYSRKAPLFAFLSYQGSQLMIQQQEPGDRHTGTLEHPYGRGVNLQIGTDDIDKLVGSLLRHNHPLRKGIEDHWRQIAEGVLSGSREFQVLDPDGYYLRFAQELGEKLASGSTQK